MNWLKWFECWMRKSHVFADFYDKDGRRSRKFVRCGCIR